MRVLMKAISQHLIWSNGMQPDELAREFARRLREEIGDELVNAVNIKNFTKPYEGACASHDYCDANMMMLAAYAGLRGMKEDDVLLELVTALFNRAWDIARGDKFYMDDVRTGDRE